MSLAGPNRKPALTAAASKIGYSRMSAGKLRDEPWQDRAWDVYDKLGPVYYMTRYRSAVARKIDYFAAKKDSPGADPDNDVTYNDEGEITAEGPATKALEVEGGPELIRRVVSELMVHWDVAGEAYLVRFEEAPLWRVLSTQELKTHTGGYGWMDDDVVKEVIDKDNVFRVWKPHPRNHWQADSPTRHVLEDAEGLILSGREIRARSQSRLSAGLWMLPDTVDFTPFGDDEEGTEDDFARQLTAHLARPLSDPGSAASLVPWIVTMDRTDIPIAKEGFIDFARDWDISIELREEQLNHVALGIDMPPELATGTAGSMNHWGSWWLTDEAVNMHVLPTVDDILDSLSINWFRPLLTVDPSSYVIWRDSSPATVQADQSDVAARAFELGAISGKAYRRAINMDEEDAPDPEELAERAALKAPTTDDTIEQAPPVRGSLDDLGVGDSPLPGAAVTAAVRRRIVATELADLDAELLAWVVEESDKEIERLLNLAITAATDPIDESLLVPLAQRLEQRIAQAQVAARGWLTRTLGRTPSDEGESLARSQGVQVIIAGIVEAVRRKLFTPDARPDPIDLGRMPDITTPTEAIRNGLSLAGGGPAVYEDGNTSELIGNGQKVKEELAGDGFFVDGYEWKYGNPANVFEPHLRLDGIQFTSWDDPRLAVGFNDSWLRRSHYRPGDHRGCQCAFVETIVQTYEDSPIPEGFESCSAVFLTPDSPDSPMSSATCGRRAGTATDIQNWEETKPWEWTREQFDDTDGWELYDSDRPVLASNQGDRIRIYPKFFEQDVATKRYVLYHEAGHDLSTSVIAEGKWKDVMLPFADSDSIGISTRFDVSFGGAKDSGFGQNLEETLADVYANLTHRGSGFNTSFMDWETPPWNDHARELMDMIETHARKVDLPIHRPDHLK